MLQRIGIVVGFTGTISGLVGSLWHVLLPAPDANIGAGILVAVGIPLAAIGVAMCALSLIFNDRRR